MRLWLHLEVKDCKLVTDKFFEAIQSASPDLALVASTCQIFIDHIEFQRSQVAQPVGLPHSQVQGITNTNITCLFNFELTEAYLS
jgi:hypothetical protein